VDLDTFEDLWEAGTGELLSDAEAQFLLFDVLRADASQLGEHTFPSILKAYRFRKQVKAHRNLHQPLLKNKQPSSFGSPLEQFSFASV
jgi:hypothetical protein